MDISGLDIAYQSKPFKEAFHKMQSSFIQSEDYTQEIEDSISEITSALKSGKIQIRIVREKNVHAKFYIFSSNPKKSATGRERYNGSLIVGSSNLSENGLQRNYECNLETKESDEIAYALSEFNQLWKDSIPLDSSDVESSIKNTYLPIKTPKEIYYKLLLVHFGESFLHIHSSIKDLFESYKPYDYQIHAIQEGLEKLKKYKGFFLSDVVGLGKTLIATIIAKKLQVDSTITNILIITPPALEKSWKRHINNLHIANWEFTTHDSIHNVLKRKDEFELVIVDEAHNFRSSTSNRYNNLENLCKSPSPKGKKLVILLSATPQNNSPQDIANQVYLFRDRHDSIEGITHLDRFFNQIIKRFNQVKQELKQSANSDTDEAKAKRAEAKETLENISKTLRDKLLYHIMIRRTRADIEKLYADDMKEQNLSFPKISPPQELSYDLDSISHNLATQTILFLAQEENDIGIFGFYRYLIFPNLTNKGKKSFIKQYGNNANKEHFYDDTAKRLSVLIQKLLFKRFDSSIEAFKSTLQMQIKSHEALIEMFERNQIAIPKEYGNREKLYEAIESDEDKALESFLDKHESDFIKLDSSDFEPHFLEHLKRDKDALQSLLDKWRDIDSDPKLETLKEQLTTHSDHKLVVFTEAATTAKYLHSKLKDYKVLQIDASNRDALESVILENFDANYPTDRQKNDYNIIITTDTLAEGVNLHRADIIINYDTPYNATRLMQRIGRINRIGTTFEQIIIYNFKPTSLTNHIIHIIDIAFQKLQSFHYTLGEDSAIYDESEEVDSKKIFSLSIEQEKQDISPETIYQRDLKDLYKNERAFFEHIKSLPTKARTMIASPHLESFVYIKQQTPNLDSNHPYHIAPSTSLLAEPQVSECDFCAMAGFLKQHISTKPKEAPSKSDKEIHYSHIQAALHLHEKQLQAESKSESSISPQATSKHTNPDSKAINKVQSCQELPPDKKQILLKKLKQGALANLPKDINKLKVSSSAELAQKLCEIIEKHGLESSSDTNHHAIDSSVDSSFTHCKPKIEISITALPSHTTLHKE